MGWSLISADKRFYPILAFSHKGIAHMDTSKNPGLKWWMDDLIHLVELFDKGEAKPVQGVELDWEKYLNRSSKRSYDEDHPEDPETPPGCLETFNTWGYPDGLTGLTWGQFRGYNHYSMPDYCEPSDFFCSKFPAGCGPVAIGMVMHFYQRPITYNFNGNLRTVDYALMPRNGMMNLSNCNNPPAAWEEVSAFLRFVSGVHASQWCFEIAVPFYNYTRSATALYPWKVVDTFSDAGYSSPGNRVSYMDNIENLKNNLRQNRPVIFTGSSCDACLWNAHVWLCEGMIEHRMASCQIYTLLRMNWGWSNGDDGWYGISSSYTAENITYGNSNMKIVINIAP